MKRTWATILAMGLTVVGGCASNPPSPPAPAANVKPPAPPSTPAPAAQTPTPEESIIARVNGIPITRQELDKPLFQAYGLNVLLEIVLLDLAKQNAQARQIVIAPADVRVEHDLTLAKLFPDASKDDGERLLNQYLEKEHTSRVEFDTVMETNAYLRKLAEPMLAGKITDENLYQGFLTLYGETVQARHIQCSNLQEIAEVRRRLKAGESFAQVAKELSRNPRTAELGGELPPFSRATTGLPQAFKDAAFANKDGEISDPVDTGDSYQLILTEKHNPPKAVKFADVKESVRKQLYDRLMQATISDLRNQLGQQAIKTMQIADPILRKQFQDKLAQRDEQVRSSDAIRKQMQKEHDAQSLQHPTTAPSPASSPAPIPPKP